jgi:hypothetical protein
MSKTLIAAALGAEEGILCLAPRSFLISGGRLEPPLDNLCSRGTNLGGVDECWLSSTTPAGNGLGTSGDERPSDFDHNHKRALLKHAVAETPGMIRFGELVADEAFVGASGAPERVRISNAGDPETLWVRQPRQCLPRQTATQRVTP